MLFIRFQKYRMSFLADESIDQPIVKALRDNGYKVLAIAEIKPGIADEAVAALAIENKALLITADKDFGELAFQKRIFPLGVVLLRLSGLPSKMKAQIVSTAIDKHHKELINSFTVVTINTIRIRNKNYWFND
jgi:predicted nuclease of predicted toxin-antitoxin system